MDYERINPDQVKVVNTQVKEKYLTNDELDERKKSLETELSERKDAYENSKAEIETELQAINNV